MIGEWKAKVYDVQNDVFSFKTTRAVKEEKDETEGENAVLALELTEDAEKGSLVAELPDLPPRHSCYEPRWSAAAKEKGQTRRRSVHVVMQPKEHDRRLMVAGRRVVGKSKEMEIFTNLKPTVWLTEDFPLKAEEFLPLLDIFVNKVKAVRRLRELLTTKFPPGTFPVKVSIPIIPTVRLVVNFSKFVHLQPSEQFFTPLSSRRLLSLPEEEQHLKPETGNCRCFWIKWNSNLNSKTSAT